VGSITTPGRKLELSNQLITHC